MSEATNKNVFVIATKGHALHLLGLAAAKTVRLQAEVAVSQAREKELADLAATLPESVAPTARAKRVYEVGAEVEFDHGREANRKRLKGTIQGVSEDGKQYKIVVGAGFDTESYKVFGGSIVKPGSTTTEDQDEAAGVTPEAGVGDAPVPPTDAQVKAANEQIGAAFESDPLA